MTTLGHPANSGCAVDINPAAMVHLHAARQPQAPVVRYPGGDLTYRQLDDQAARLAAALVDNGIEPGTRVAYLGLNSPAFLVTLLASFHIGAIFVPVNFRITGAEFEVVLQRSAAGTIVCEGGHRSVVDNLRDRVAITTFLLVDDDPAAPLTDTAIEGLDRWSTVLAAATPTARIVTARFDDPAMLMFTSGTTGGALTPVRGHRWWITRRTPA
ncbi:AMP-binding protein [Rhodococcus pyridinivorans]|uniref:AMP-binding protein n=1 Tax=Rhodococcus pyridinivorans TaxID=103816 RepID=UPI001E559E3D|nr:AMP-binding protein [Rhodococcus pyridinivorans]MCD5422500.1 AMP-binding protein [Rhodococcus pyridinivorans]